jgi:hypothetical protein
MDLLVLGDWVVERIDDASETPRPPKEIPS